MIDIPLTGLLVALAALPVVLVYVPTAEARVMALDRDSPRAMERSRATRLQQGDLWKS